jgi:CRISPR-associated protein Cas1
VRKLLNTLYVTTADSYLSLEGETVVVSQGDSVLGRVPLHNIEGIVYFGYKGASPALMGACADREISLNFLTPSGRFLARVSGSTRGNVVLRQTQVIWSCDPIRTIDVGRMFLTGKIYNSRWVLERTLRDHGQRVNTQRLLNAVNQLKDALAEIESGISGNGLMGVEGAAAKTYFQVFDEMILRNKDSFRFDGRNRRPPLDPVNAMLSLCYTLLASESASALETVGLDPYIGFLHQIRPGRKSLALDLLEELRAPMADRFVLSLINLGSITPDDFQTKENGAVILQDEGRQKLLAAWQKHKQESLTHPFLKEKIPWGLVPYAQAMLLARYLRGDLDAYPPFLWK